MQRVIVFGNEKGGSGKTTTAMHLIMCLLKLGFKVASLDIDARQQTLTRYIENRKHIKEQEKLPLELPRHLLLERGRQEEEKFQQFLTEHNDYDFIIVDTPGSDNPLNRLVHSYANIIITPINDSFVDFDLLCRVDPNNFNMIKPGAYSAMVWEQKMKRASRDKTELQWFIVRNRLSALEVINKKNITNALQHISKRLGCKISPGFGDRVVFKELFLNGLTLLDAGMTNKVRMNPSLIAARQELRNFLKSLNISNKELK